MNPFEKLETEIVELKKMIELLSIRDTELMARIREIENKITQLEKRIELLNFRFNVTNNQQLELIRELEDALEHDAGHLRRIEKQMRLWRSETPS